VICIKLSSFLFNLFTVRFNSVQRGEQDHARCQKSTAAAAAPPEAATAAAAAADVR